MSVTRRLLSVALAPLLFSTFGGIVCLMSAGPTLGLFVGVLVVVTVLVPPLAVTERRTVDRALALVATFSPLAVICFLPSFLGDPLQRIRVSEWLAVCLVIVAYTAALAGLSAVLPRVTRSPILSAALTVIAGLAWLTWPIWASPSWKGGDSEAAVARLIAIHPGMAVNGQVSRALGNWTEQSVAYHLTELGQSVNFILPQSVWPCVLLHGLPGAALLLLASWLEKPRQLPDATPAPVTD